jgi:hypothetical protein
MWPMTGSTIHGRSQAADLEKCLVQAIEDEVRPHRAGLRPHLSLFRRERPDMK